MFLVDPDYSSRSLPYLPAFYGPPRETTKEVIVVPPVSKPGSGPSHRRYKPTAMQLRVEGFPHLQSCLLDTGAALSVIDELLVAHLPINTDYKVNLKGIGFASTIGHVSVNFEVPANSIDDDGKEIILKFCHEFHVVRKLGPGMVLGTDFIFGHELDLIGRKRIAVLHEKYSWKIWPMRKGKNETGEEIWTIDEPSPSTLIAKTNSVIPPRSHAWIPISPSSTLSSDPVNVHPSIWEDETFDVILSIPAMILPPNPTHVLVANLGTADAAIASNFQLCQASAFLGGEIATGHMFHMAPADASPQEDLESETLFASKHDVEDQEGKERLVADLTKTVDDLFNVGSAVTDDIINVLRSFKHVFSTDGKPGHVPGFPLSIPLKPEAKLRPEAPRKVSPQKRDIIDKTIEKLLAHDVIEPSSSATSYPVVLIKQGPKWRMCVDYRTLNDDTVEDRYPLPRIDDIFESLSKGRVFSSVDAISGYHQLDLEPSDKWKTAFICHKGLFQYKRVPFGLKNAPSHFQRFMDVLLGSMRWQNAMVYLDDAVIFSPCAASHAKDLESFLTRCSDFGLKLSPSKCFFAVNSLNLLGRLVTVDGVSIIPDRAEAIRKIAPPKNLHEVYRLLGLFNYYRPFIPRFAELTARLSAKTKGVRYVAQPGKKHKVLKEEEEFKSAKSVPITCDQEDIKSIEVLKEALCKQTVLAYPDRDREWFLYVDASKEAYAAALHQQFHRPARSSTLKEQSTQDEDDVEPLVLPAQVVDLPSSSPSKDDFATAQRNDPLWARIIGKIKRGDPPRGYAIYQGVLTRVDTDTICLPKDLQDKVFEEAHAGHPGHTRTHAKVEEQFYHPSLWEKTKAWVKHCPTCIRTKLAKPTGRLDLNDDFMGIPFHTVSMDLMLGLPGPKDACLIIVDVFSKYVLMHPMTGTATATQIMHAFENLVLRRGWKPSRLISDSDQRFIGEVGKALAERIGAEISPSAPYHQQANPVERYVQMIKNSLTALCLDEDPESWPDHLLALEVAHNSTPSTVTTLAPFDIVYVDRPSLLSRLTDHSGVSSLDERFFSSAARVRRAMEAMKNARSKQKDRYDKKKRKLPKLKEGDLVMIRLPDRPLFAGRQLRTKIDSPLEGPFKVKRVISDHRVELDLPQDMRVKQPFDVSHLQLVPPPEEDPFGRGGLTIESGADAVYEPQRIVQERYLSGKRQYYVKWRGSSRHTWEYEDDLLDQGCEDVVADWQDKLDGLSTPPLPSAFPAEVDKEASMTQAPSPHCPSAQEANTVTTSRPGQTSIVDGKKVIVQERPVAFSSRETTKSEKKLVAIELEASAVVWAYHKFLPLFEGCKVHVITDHSPLVQVFSSPTSRVHSGALLRAKQRLAPYVHLLTFHHRPGSAHVNVDSLSRLRQISDGAEAAPEVTAAVQGTADTNRSPTSDATQKGSARAVIAS